MITLKINMVTIQDYYSLTLIVWCMKLNGMCVNEDFSKDKETFDFSNYPTEWKYYDDSSN